MAACAREYITRARKYIYTYTHKVQLDIVHKYIQYCWWIHRRLTGSLCSKCRRCIGEPQYRRFTRENTRRMYISIHTYTQRGIKSNSLLFIYIYMTYWLSPSVSNIAIILEGCSVWRHTHENIWLMYIRNTTYAYIHTYTYKVAFDTVDCWWVHMELTGCLQVQ